MGSPKNKKNSDGEKLTDIFLKYRGILERLVGSIVKPHDIEDIVQETFVRSFEKNLKHKIEHPKTYLYTTARNLAFNYISRKSCELERTTGDFDALDVFDDRPSLDSDMESREKFQFFCRAVRDLPPQCRRAFILKRIYGLSQKEIAAYLKISERTVEGHVAKGMVRCAQFLKEHGYQVNRRKTNTARTKKYK